NVTRAGSFSPRKRPPPDGAGSRANVVAPESPHLGGKVSAIGGDQPPWPLSPSREIPAMRYAGAAFIALLIAPFPGAAAELCPTLSSVDPTPCESLIDPTSDLLQNRVNSRLNITGATPDDGQSVWAQSHQAPFQVIEGAPAATTTYFGADYRLGSGI